MKKIAVAVLAFALLVPAALAAPPAQSSSAFCKANATSLVGAGKLYRNAGACVAAQNAQQAASSANAAKACKAESADPSFAAGHARKTFAQAYASSANGANGKGNAFGKCVSQKARAQTAAAQAAETKAAKACRTDAMRAQTGAGKLYRNFGACVSARSKSA